jgi:hypothetical protein
MQRLVSQRKKLKSGGDRDQADKEPESHRDEEVCTSALDVLPREAYQGSILVLYRTRERQWQTRS